jgi:transcriptional regulator with XRE-family HTH domain
MYENGNREPDFKTLELIANYFDVNINYLLGSYPFKNNKEFTHSVNIAALEDALDHPDKQTIIMNIINNLKIVIYIKSDNTEELTSEIKEYALNLINKFERNETLSDIELYEFAYMIYEQVGLDSNGYGHFQFYDGNRYGFKKDYADIRKVSLDVSNSLVIIDESNDLSEYIRYTYRNGFLLSEEELNKSSKLDVKDNSNEKVYTNDEINEILGKISKNPEIKALIEATQDMDTEDIEFIKAMIERMRKSEKNKGK